MHELLHVAGLFHEHQRPDAREYIRLNCFNMDGGCDWNVKQVPFMGAIAKSHGKYNYDSLMHYPCDYNAKNDAIPTIDAATNRIGQRSGLSQGDVDAINAMYYDISPSRGKPNFPAQPLPRLHFNGNCNNVAYNPKMRCKFLREALQDYKAQLVGSLTARNGRESYWRDQVQRVARELQDLDCPTTAMALGKYYANASPGFTPLSVTSELAGYWDSQTWLSADFNGDGKSDLAVVYKADGGKAHVMLFLFDGNSYLNHSTTVLEKFLDGTHWLAGDVNGDGLVDLIHVYGHKEGEIKAHAMVHLSNGNSFEYAFTARLAKFWASQRWVTGDVDGDGKSDLVTIYKGPDNRARAMTFFSSGSGFPREGFTKLAKFWDRQKWMIGDVNADKKADLINLYEGPQGKAHVMFHLGGSEGFSDGGFSILAGYSDSQYWTVGDVNGDGRDDLINVYRGPNKASHVMTHLSSGSEYVYGNTSVLGEHPKKGFWAAARVGPSQVAGLVSVAGW